ncbi:hypothetical protein MMC29_000337 [Sticta canariensis]|nr:hypothetical protein [Sticta canariensis]
MVTDILIIVIPVQLLWNVHIKRRQKIILGTTLSLSIVMILTAIIRISAIRIGKEQVDLVWECFWQIIENCLAIAMVCLSAFRAVFVGTHADPRGNKPRYVHKKNLRNHHNRKNWTDIESEETETLPKIPGATMTGMKTLIHGRKRPEESIIRSVDGNESNDQSTLYNQGNSSKIWIDYSITQETGEV